jgi:transposase
MGWKIPVSTAMDQVKWIANRFEPLWDLALEDCIEATVLHTDSTGLPVLDKDSDKGLRIGSMWGYIGENPELKESTGTTNPVACLVYTSTGKKKGQQTGERGPEDILARRTGYTVADASNVFDASFAREELLECGCNMHARRYFVKALDAGDKRATLPIAAFKRLYIIEHEIRDFPLKQKQAEREARSRPVYDSLIYWCEQHLPHEPPGSKLGRAMRYLLNHRIALTRFIDDSIVPIDNGPAERLHVRTILTRKNYLFLGSDEGGRRAAIIYTMIANCVLAGVNVVEYFADVLPRLGDRLDGAREKLRELMPARWKARREVAQMDADGELTGD